VTEAVRRILAVDFGDARTGLAATDWTGAIAVPLGRIDARDDAAVAASATRRSWSSACR
jgi:RNase H-fold protein (predicted Holliday junction resolvase)